jgi:acyl-CoA reductase-like NAD-dependent aldehyde dehydrogenase
VTLIAGSLHQSGEQGAAQSDSLPVVRTSSAELNHTRLTGYLDVADDADALGRERIYREQRFMGVIDVHQVVELALGFYYQPTVLDQVTAGMPVLTEEVFGPAVPIIRAADADDAIRLANDTPFGLGSNVWTSDLARGEALAIRLDAGHTAVNGMTSSDPRLPFGGVKDSG